MSAKPAAASALRNSASVSAPATQPRPLLHVGAGGVVHVGVGDHVGDGEAAAGAQDAGGFAQDLALVAGEVDHAVGDDDVDAGVGERHVLEVALANSTLSSAGLGGVGAREVEHLVGHVEPDGAAGGADAAGGDQDVGAGARAEVEHGLALVQVGDRGRNAAAERGLDGRGRDALVGASAAAVERRAEHLGPRPSAGDGAPVAHAVGARNSRRSPFCGRRAWPRRRSAARTFSRMSVSSAMRSAPRGRRG